LKVADGRFDLFEVSLNVIMRHGKSAFPKYPAAI
jgi:hypothetical protein